MKNKDCTRCGMPVLPSLEGSLCLRCLIDEGQPIPKTLNNPVQEKAFAMCKSNDHSWMKDDEYAGDSYIREIRTSEGQYTVTIGFVHTCYFCGHKEFSHF